MSKKVAVIGAGASGLVAARHNLSAGHSVTVFEQSADLGGVWLYAPDDPTAYSAAYEGLITNMPKQLMELEGLPWPEGTPTFQTAAQILAYLRKYAEGIPIEFNTTVVRVERDQEQWKVSVQRKAEEAIEADFFDVLFVCNGHHGVPSIFIDFSPYKRKYIHSHNYRRASDYKDQTVAVVGTGYSGIDVCLQIADLAKKVHFIGNTNWPGLPEKIEYVEGQVKGTTSDSLVLGSGQELSGYDCVIDCTGYSHSMPFLESEGLIRIAHRGKAAEPLWMYVVHMHHPTSLFCIGLNDQAITFPLYDIQVKFALSLVSGKLKPPPLETMEQWRNDRIRYLETEGRSLSSFYCITLELYDYMQEMARLGQFSLPKNYKLIEKLNPWIDIQRSSNPAGYKSMKIESTDDDFTAVL